jgi:hypothetical protein
MKVIEAIGIVAQQIAANAVRDVEWEDYPNIGEYDWIWITELLEVLVPEAHAIDEAFTLLEQRAEEAANG